LSAQEIKTGHTVVMTSGSLSVPAEMVLFGKGGKGLLLRKTSTKVILS